jgi:hypothetical protein
LKVHKTEHLLDLYIKTINYFLFYSYMHIFNSNQK